MQKKINKLGFLNKGALKIFAVMFIIVLAILLLWQGNANSNQALPASVAKLSFKGEYRLGGGEWQKIEEGKHISSTKGDVTLRGNFHLYTPDDEYIGVLSENTLIAFYTDHVNLTVYANEGEPYSLDYENPLYGVSACGAGWMAYDYMGDGTKPIDIVVHNPHKFGNENSIDELLDKVAIWSGMDFEKSVLESGASQRNIGLLFMIIALVLLGTALFSSLIYIKNSKIIWIFGMLIMFAGAYFAYSADGVSFWNESTVSNTIVLGCSMIFYMLFLCLAIVHYLGKTKKIGTVAITILGSMDASVFILPLVSNLFFYDLWIYWVIAQTITNIVLFVCLVKEFSSSKGKSKVLYIGSLLPLIAFWADAFMTWLGVWQGGMVSMYVFIILFIAAMIVVLRIIPHSINAVAKTRELETEKTVLNAQLTESRVSIMMSQIRPHFIYNTLGSIEQLCEVDPPKAGELVHNFAKYLRGNFGELDNPKPILMSQEMEHVRYYVSIEKVRFPDMTFTFEMNSIDFKIPALTIQPIVENAIKHGLMKLQKGGTIHVVSYETNTHYHVLVEDDGVGFDTSVLLDERTHLGLRNIRGRLSAMVNGTLEIESTVGEGTKVLISIPKEM